MYTKSSMLASFNRRTFIRTGAVFGTGLILGRNLSPALAQTPSFSATVLTGLDSLTSPEAVGLQDDGAVVFNATIDGTAGVFRWLDGELARLGGNDGAVTATSVSDSGIVTGWTGVPSSGTPTSGPEAVLIGDENLVFMPGGSPGYALGSNEAELIVGFQSSGTATHLPTRWTTTEPIALGLPNGFPTGEALDVNILDQIVGWVGDFESGTQQGVIWEDDKPTLMGTLGGAISTAIKINDSGLAVGQSTIVAGAKDLLVDETLAFEWLAGEQTALPALDGARQHVPHDLNNTNLIVGSAIMGDGSSVAVIWSAGAIDVLNDLVSVDSPLQLTKALSTNRFGSILCAALDGDGQTVFVMLDVLGN